MKSYLSILRPKNLAIVALAQFLIYWVYILPNIKEGLVLSGRLWWLFILDTVIIAGSGYVINDFFDMKADLYNKPEKIFIGDNLISSKSAMLYYLVLVLIGFFVAFYIAFSIEKIHLLAIYPAAVILLFLYSYRFKKQPLTGNIVVATFCAFVPGIIWYAESDVLSELRITDIHKYSMIINLFVAYIVFAFLSTMVREVVKDIEDIDGDLKSDYNTLPIATSVSAAKKTALTICGILFLSYSIWFRDWTVYEIGFPGGLLIILLMIIPTVIIFIKLIRAKERQSYTSISKWLKILMVLSLIVFLCIPYLSASI